MRQLTKIQSIVFAVGALLMVVGVGCVVFGVAMPPVQKAGAVAFAVGALCFAGMQMSQVYDGDSIVVRRLRRIMVFADVCFIIAAVLLVENVFLVVFPYVADTVEGYNNYVHYVHNNWVVALLVAAILEMYSTHRISYELNKKRGAF